MSSRRKTSANEVDEVVLAFETAIAYDKQTRYQDALNFYKIGLEGLMEQLRLATSAEKRSLLEQEAAAHMARAETIKGFLEQEKNTPSQRKPWYFGGFDQKEPQQSLARTHSYAEQKAQDKISHISSKPAQEKTPRRNSEMKPGSKFPGQAWNAHLTKNVTSKAQSKSNQQVSKPTAQAKTKTSASRDPSKALPSAKSNDAFEAVIMDEILCQSSGITWDQIAGLEAAKGTLQETVILPNLRPDLFTGLRAPARGVLLFGPPGTGKTLLARAVASETNFTFFSISASSLVSRYLGDGEKLVRALFTMARRSQPSIIFMDEIDSLLASRSDNEHEASRRLKTEFMVQLDGAGSSSEDRVLVMGATNIPQCLDEAVLRRLPKRIYIPLPDTPARTYLVSKLLEDQKHTLKKNQMTRLVQQTEGYSCSDLTAVCKEAALQPLRELGRMIRTIEAKDVRAITFEDFELALNQIRPSVSVQSIETFLKWDRQYGSH